MATIRQRKVAKALVKALEVDKTPSAGKVLKSVGYGTGLQNQPKRVLKSKGVQEALNELGFTVDGADGVVKKILYKSKREDFRLKAADLVYKRLGAYEDTEKGAHKTLIINVTAPAAEKYGINARTGTDHK